jgi:hypothetical protein
MAVEEQIAKGFKMSSNTVVRAFKSQNNFIAAAKQKDRPWFYEIKKCLHALITFGQGVDLDAAREERREQEITHIAIDVLKNLPESYSKLDQNSNIILSTNLHQGYQIKQEGAKIYLYAGTPSKFDQSKLILNENAKTMIADLSDKLKFNQFILRWSECKQTQQYQKLIQKRYTEIYALQYNNAVVIKELRSIATQFCFEESKQKSFSDYFLSLPHNRNILDELKNKNLQLLEYLKSKIEENPLGPGEYSDIIQFFLDANKQLQDKLLSLELNKYLISEGIYDLIAEDLMADRHNLATLSLLL